MLKKKYKINIAKDQKLLLIWEKLKFWECGYNEEKQSIYSHFVGNAIEFTWETVF